MSKKKKIILAHDRLKKMQQHREAEKARLQADIDKNAGKSLANIHVTNTSIFLISQVLVDLIERLKDEDHNYSEAKLGEKNHLVKQKLKMHANGLITELDKVINQQKQLFSEEYIEDHNASLAIFEAISEHLGIHNIEKLHALAGLLVTDDPSILVKYYNERNSEYPELIVDMDEFNETGKTNLKKK